MLLNKSKKIINFIIVTSVIFHSLLIASEFKIAYAFDTSSDNYLKGYYNNLLDDDTFINKNGMTVDEIQTFLTTSGSYLATYKGGDNRTAAQIIWDAAQGNTVDSRSNGWKPDGHPDFPDISQTTGTVNPKVILVTLQKEQSLITGKFRLNDQGDFTDTEGINYALQHAMGYACPDSDSWDPAMFGFSKQIDWGSWQLRFSWFRAQDTGYSDFQINQTKEFLDYYVPECTSSNCIESHAYHNVTFLTKATASLFRYTPYLFNGNYNFWKLYTNWFGDPNYAPPTDPAPAPRKAGDTNGDNATIGIADLSVLCDTWGQNVTANTGADLNGDGVVNIADLSILCDNWGR